MAEYSIKHICGHELVHQIYGTDIHKWLAKQLCKTCYKAEQQAKHDIKNAESAAYNIEQGLPPLKGTEKQVAWAETIRAEKIKELNDCLTKISVLEASQDLTQLKVEKINKIKKLAQMWRKEESASAWINLSDQAITRILNDGIRLC